MLCLNLSALIIDSLGLDTDLVVDFGPGFQRRDSEIDLRADSKYLLSEFLDLKSFLNICTVGNNIFALK